ncbi:intradiol ring-cleavage dioxygenase [Aureobasidium pullulans EXF-150]|uniref:Intradiol ring-cleavage dioxygenase n=1 Tax=Aureobasidium pullulans EXF-150 TaxID=1043002 RepID=A0A074XGA5_AURPU|nr:intradiol ring-cleavage dioxygenase [Aureobasidium pullulans EXF-150]KEQ81087.1 intradiol ring-cleavage dioxygenase [Aureobasidium pullulans EXF-150]
MVHFKNILASLALASAAAAHPGHDPREEALERRTYYDSVPQTKRSLSHCEARIKARGLGQRSLARRDALATNMRQKRGLPAAMEKRDAASVLNTTHLSNDTSINMDVTEEDLFGNGSCILVPEFIRKNITENQEGVPITLDIQVIDVNTCEPVPDVYIDFWHCNATGVYSGIVTSGNGDSLDTVNVNTTFLRDIAETDTEGVATFESIVPGHYTSRANHVHIVTHTNTTLYVNGTMSSGSVQHVGQLFFDMSLLKQVEATYPYNTNTQDWTTNSEDSILSEETATDGVDPVVEYILLGDDITDGVLAWISMGVDMINNQTITPAGNYYRTGGVMDSSSSGMGGGMGGGGDEPGNGTSNGTAGAPPS